MINLTSSLCLLIYISPRQVYQKYERIEVRDKLFSAAEHTWAGDSTCPPPCRPGEDGEVGVRLGRCRAPWSRTLDCWAAPTSPLPHSGGSRRKLLDRELFSSMSGGVVSRYLRWQTPSGRDHLALAWQVMVRSPLAVWPASQPSLSLTRWG